MPETAALHSLGRSHVPAGGVHGPSTGPTEHGVDTVASTDTEAAPDHAATSWAGGRNRRQRRRRTLRIAGVVTTLLAFAGAVVVGAVLSLDRSLTRVEVDGLADGTPPGTTESERADGGDAGAETHPSGTSDLDVHIDRDADPVTVLVLGSDTREVLTEEERAELGTGMAWGERTEVVALVRVDDAAGELRMVNIPRDSLVTRCDGSRGRINAAYGIGEDSEVGGVSCVVQSVTAWSGIDIDHAVKVDFRGFIDIVDAIGGVEMFIQEPLQDERANLDLEAGCQMLDGADALAFARARSIDDDFGRISRQQRLLVELRDQVQENGVFAEPVRTLRLAEAIAGSMQVDSSLTLNRIRQLVMGHRGTLQEDLVTRTVPGERATGTEAWLLEPDEQAAQELFTWLLEGDPQPEEEPDAPTAGAPADATTGDEAAEADEVDEEDVPAGSQPQRCP